MGDEGDQKQDQKDEEQDLRNSSRCPGDSSKPQSGSDESDDQKQIRKAQRIGNKPPPRPMPRHCRQPPLVSSAGNLAKLLANLRATSMVSTPAVFAL